MISLPGKKKWNARLFCRGGVVAHRVFVVGEDAGGDGDFAGGHFAEGPLPGVEFFEGAGGVTVEADGVVSDFVEEDGGGDGAFGAWGGDDALDAAVGVLEFPGHAGHGGAPVADGEFVFGFEFAGHGGVLARGEFRHRRDGGLRGVAK